MTSFFPSLQQQGTPTQAKNNTLYNNDILAVHVVRLTPQNLDPFILLRQFHIAA